MTIPLAVFYPVGVGLDALPGEFGDASVREVISFLHVTAFAVHTLDIANSPLVKLYTGWLAVLSFDPIFFLGSCDITISASISFQSAVPPPPPAYRSHS